MGSWDLNPGSFDSYSRDLGVELFHLIYFRFAGLGLVPVAVIISLALWFAPQETVGTDTDAVDVKVTA